MDVKCVVCGDGEDCGGLQRCDCPCGAFFHHDEPCMSRLGIRGFKKRRFVAGVAGVRCGQCQAAQAESILDALPAFKRRPFASVPVCAIAQD